MVSPCVEAFQWMRASFRHAEAEIVEAVTLSFLDRDTKDRKFSQIAPFSLVSASVSML
jgi:hypothetical protein